MGLKDVEEGLDETLSRSLRTLQERDRLLSQKESIEDVLNQHQRELSGLKAKKAAMTKEMERIQHTLDGVKEEWNDITGQLGLEQEVPFQVAMQYLDQIHALQEAILEKKELEQHMEEEEKTLEPFLKEARTLLERLSIGYAEDQILLALSSLKDELSEAKERGSLKRELSSQAEL